MILPKLLTVFALRLRCPPGFTIPSVIAVGTEYAYDLTTSYLDKAIDAADQWINSTANKITDKITNIVKGGFS